MTKASGKLVYGVGVNDADYVVYPRINGKQVMCPFYKAWKGMLRRCYSSKDLLRNPAYINCSVCDSWLVFSNFKAWMEKQDWHNKDLDKDLLVYGNKVYSPETCLFISESLNNLLTTSRSSRGKYHIGVDFVERDKKFRSQCSDCSGAQKFLGLFDTELEAAEAYIQYKKEYVLKVAGGEVDSRIRNALIFYSDNLKVEI